MPNDNEYLMEEWKMLRDEIARKQNFVERLVLTTVAGSLTIFSFAAALKELAPTNAFVALLPIVLTTMSYFWILRYLYSGFRISKYIKEFIEPRTGLRWETSISQSRRRTQPEGAVKARADVFYVFYHFMLGFSLFVCIVFIWGSYLSYGNFATQTGSGTAQVSQVPVSISWWLTISAVLFLVVWYLLAKYLFIEETRKSIQALVTEMQVTAD